MRAYRDTAAHGVGKRAPVWQEEVRRSRMTSPRGRPAHCPKISPSCDTTKRTRGSAPFGGELEEGDDIIQCVLCTQGCQSMVSKMHACTALRSRSPRSADSTQNARTAATMPTTPSIFCLRSTCVNYDHVSTSTRKQTNEVQAHHFAEQDVCFVIHNRC